MRAIGAWSFVLGVVALGLGISAPARANGRFPESQRLLEHPSDPNRLYLAATYGLLVTDDRGQSWYSICEQAFAGDYLEGDPLLEVLGDGSLVAGIYNDLNVSRDCGCGWQRTLGLGAMDSVNDVTVDRNGRLLAIVRDLGSGVARVRIHESTDGGQTWTVLANLADTINDAYTIDVAPSDPMRLYITAVTGMPQNPALMLTSKDRGKTWTEAQIPGTSNGVQPFIAAVHPTNPERVFVRTDDWDGSGDHAAQDALLQSTDGGKNWTEVLRKNAKLFGFALSPDGNTVLAGYGDPVQAGGRTSNPDDYGLYKAAASSVPGPFERIFTATISCLRWTAKGLYACTVQNHPEVPSPGMSVGFAPDANFTAATANPFSSLLDVKKVKGPLGCTTSMCADTWSMPREGAAAVCQQLEATCSVDATRNVVACAGGGTGGAGGAGGAAGTGGGGGDGCGCALASPDATDTRGGARSACLSAVALLAAGAVWRRRRRGSRLDRR